MVKNSRTRWAALGIGAKRGRGTLAGGWNKLAHADYISSVMRSSSSPALHRGRIRDFESWLTARGKSPAEMALKCRCGMCSPSELQLLNSRRANHVNSCGRRGTANASEFAQRKYLAQNSDTLHHEDKMLRVVALIFVHDADIDNINSKLLKDQSVAEVRHLLYSLIATSLAIGG
jgi:hypothetical protein